MLARWWRPCRAAGGILSRVGGRAAARVVAARLGTQTAREWVDERRLVNLVGWRMRTRSDGRRDVGVGWDGSTG